MGQQKHCNPFLSYQPYLRWKQVKEGNPNLFTLQNYLAETILDPIKQTKAERNEIF